MLAALFVLVLGGGYWWHVSRQAAAPGTSASSTLTAAEVAAHDSAQSCYTSISGNVYDLTSWISQHPGGPEAILSLCGTDGTAAFEAQHGGERRPNEELATFKIGTLAP